MSSPPALWELPGPRTAGLAAVQECRGGRSVFLVLPEGRPSPGEIANWLEDLRTHLGAQLIISEGGGGFATTVVEALDDPNALRGSPDPLAELIHWPQLHRRRLIATSWENDLDEVVQRWPSLIKSSGHPPSERPTLLLALRRQDVADLDHLLSRVDQVTVSVRWWWQVVTRLDTEATIALTDDGRLSPLQAAFAAELTAWDLQAAAHLGQTWSGTHQSLVEQINELDQLPVTESDADRRRRRGPADQPPHHLSDAWHQGRVDEWDGMTYTTGTIDDAYLTRLRWRSQLRLIFPRLEQQRSEFEQELRNHPDTRLREALDRLGNDKTLELGDMLSLIRKHYVRLPGNRFRLLKACRAARNQLAHLDPVPEGDLALLIDALGLRR